MVVGQECKIYLFANDYTLLMPKLHLQVLLQEFALFVAHRNIKMKTHKTEALNISLSKKDKTELLYHETLKYLSVLISPQTDILYDLIYKHLQTVIQQKWKDLARINHTWFVRMALYKMAILP